MTLKQIGCISTESCVGRCGSFDPRTKCQCDSMCMYYGSCCRDIDDVCPKKSQCRSRNFSYLYFSHYKREIPSFSSCNTTVFPSFPWRHLQWGRRRFRGGDDSSGRDNCCTHCQHTCSNYPYPYHSSTPLPPRPLGPVRGPRRSPLQRPSVWCLSAAEEYVDLRIPRLILSWQFRGGKENSCTHRLIKTCFFLQRGIFFRVGWRVHPPRISQTNQGCLGNPRAHRRCVHAHQLSWKILHL